MISSMVRTKVKNSLSIQEKGLEPRLHLKEKLTKRQHSPSDFICGIIKVVTLFWFQIVDITAVIVFIDIQRYAIDSDCAIIYPMKICILDIIYGINGSFADDPCAAYLSNNSIWRSGSAVGNKYDANVLAADDDDGEADNERFALPA